MTCADIALNEPKWLQDSARILRRAVRDHGKLFPETGLKFACQRSQDGQFLEGTLRETWTGGSASYHLSVHAWSGHLVDLCVYFADVSRVRTPPPLPVANAPKLYNLLRHCSAVRAQLVVRPKKQPKNKLVVVGTEVSAPIAGLNGAALRDFLEEGRTVASRTLALLLRDEGPNYWQTDAHK